MQQVTLKQLLEAGVHFGHQTRRWNPKMKRYIFGEKSGIYIINLELTLGCLTKGMMFLRKVASEGKDVLFVGTKKQAQESIGEAATKCGMPFVRERWLGGMLTNFTTIKKSIARLEWIDQTEKAGDFKFITKKEVGGLMKEREKLVRYLTGIRYMKRLPAAIFLVDTKKEEIALHEARKLGIPSVALIDTNCDPDMVDFPIPGNDDAIRAIKLFSELAAEAIMEGRNEFLKIAPTAADINDETHAEEEIEAPAIITADAVVPSVEPRIDPVIPKVEELEAKFLETKEVKEVEDLKAKKLPRSKELKKAK